jgi:hypothetical protein
VLLESLEDFNPPKSVQSGRSFLNLPSPAEGEKNLQYFGANFKILALKFEFPPKFLGDPDVNPLTFPIFSM